MFPCVRNFNGPHCRNYPHCPSQQGTCTQWGPGWGGCEHRAPSSDGAMWGGLWGCECSLAGFFPHQTGMSHLCCCLGLTSLTSQQLFARENEIRKVFQVFVSVVQWQTRLEPVLFVPSAGPKLGKTATKAVGDTQLSTRG